VILGSIRVRKEHPMVRRHGPAGAIQVMRSYGVEVAAPERLQNAGWAFVYDVVPPDWIDGWWTETYEGGLIHKVYGRRWTPLARTPVTLETVRAARDRLKRDNPSGRSAYPYHYDQSILVSRDVAGSGRKAMSIAKHRTGEAVLRSEPGADYWHVPLLDPELMRQGSYVTRPAGKGVQVRAARFKAPIEREPLARTHDGNCRAPRGRERLVCHEEFVGPDLSADVRMTEAEFGAIPEGPQSIRQLTARYGKARITPRGRSK